MKKYLSALHIFVIFSFSSCSQELSMDTLKKEKLSYGLLPDVVKLKFKEVIYNRVPAGDPNHYFFNFDSTKVEFSQSELGNDMVKTFQRNGSYYEFNIKGKKLILKANLGDPFIVFNSSLYYPNQYNTGGDDYKTVEYIKIDFSELVSED